MSPRDRLRELLLHEWDPHDVMRRIDVYGASALSRYDNYLDPLIEIIRLSDSGPADGRQARALEDAVISFLREREAESMCFPSLGTERLRRVARRAIAAGRGLP